MFDEDEYKLKEMLNLIPQPQFMTLYSVGMMIDSYLSPLDLKSVG